MKTLISEIANKCDWKKTVNENYESQCIAELNKLTDMLPSGSGFDNGCTINIEKSGSKKVIIDTSFHHLDEGYYTGWTEHKVIVTPCFNGFDLRITGKNENGIKDYMYDVFYSVLSEGIK